MLTCPNSKIDSLLPLRTLRQLDSAVEVGG